MSEYFENGVVSKMSMGGSSNSSNACKISMLWNWYTIDTCFIAKSWKNDTRGKFAGSCIGCFLLVFIAQWLNRVSRQFDIEIARRRKLKVVAKYAANSASTSDMSETGAGSTEAFTQTTSLCNEPDWKTSLNALTATLSHTWYFNFGRRNAATNSNLETSVQCCPVVVDVYPTLLDHILRALVFTLQWGLSYIIMLLFMYYNGYIIISCLLGALFGRLFFNYEPLATLGSGTTTVAHDKEENDRKCCM